MYFSWHKYVLLKLTNDLAITWFHRAIFEMHAFALQCNCLPSLKPNLLPRERRRRWPLYIHMEGAGGCCTFTGKAQVAAVPSQWRRRWPLYLHSESAGGRCTFTGKTQVAAIPSQGRRMWPLYLYREGAGGRLTFTEKAQVAVLPTKGRRRWPPYLDWEGASSRLHCLLVVVPLVGFAGLRTRVLLLAKTVTETAPKPVHADPLGRARGALNLWGEGPSVGVEEGRHDGPSTCGERGHQWAVGEGGHDEPSTCGERGHQWAVGEGQAREAPQPMWADMLLYVAIYQKWRFTILIYWISCNAIFHSAINYKNIILRYKVFFPTK